MKISLFLALLAAFVASAASIKVDDAKGKPNEINSFFPSLTRLVSLANIPILFKMDLNLLIRLKAAAAT